MSHSEDPHIEDDVRGNAAVLESDPEVVLKEPRKYRVLLHNDHYTTMDFVVEVLVGIFYLSETEAISVMLEIHKKGVGQAGIFGRDVAETKVKQVVALARQNEFPLQASMEAVS